MNYLAAFTKGSSLTCMNKDSLLNGLQTKCYGKNLLYYDVIDSTNSHAIELMRTTGIPEGTVVITENQAKGRGTSEKRWESATPEGLWMSVVTYEPLRQAPLAFIPGIAFAKTLREIYGIEAHLKWPNDILVGTKKIGGILCESSSYQGRKAWVIGVGLNVNQSYFPEIISGKAISMKLVTGLDYDISKVFQHCIKAFEDIYLSPDDIISSWKKFSTIIGKEIVAIKRGIPIRVKALDITRNGLLVIEHENGKREEWASVADLDIQPDY